MNRLCAILLFILPAVGWGCSEEKETLPTQRQRIVSYLRSTHIPQLLPAEEVEEGSTQGFYTEAGHTVYRYIATYYDPDRGSYPEVTERSTVTVTFGIHVFDYTNIPSSRLPLYSNDASLENAYLQNGLSPGAWPFQPLTIDLGHDDILKGFRLALVGCREGDEVEAYMTYNLAFGDTNFATVPRQSPIAIFFTVDRVE